jgi:cell division protein FtsB
MRELQSKQKIKRRLYSPWSLLALLLFTILVAKGAVSILMKENQSSSDVQDLQAKVVDLTNQETKLNDNLSELNSPSGVNEEIKEKYNVSEAGEHVAVLVDRDNASSTATSTPAHWYRRAWDAIISAL